MGLRIRPLVLVLVLVMTASLVQGLAFVSAPHAARALASAASGTGGEFVATQGRVMDTRPSPYTVGPYATPMTANAWRSIQVTGVSPANVPASGAGAVQVTVTALAPGSVEYAQVSADLSTPKPQQVVNYGYETGADSNTTIVPLTSSGKIKVLASTAVNLVVDVQGYYTNGSDTASGGYVPVSPTRVANTTNGTGLPQAQITSGSTVTIDVSTLPNIPSDATAVFVNIAAGDYSGANGYLTPYASDATPPTVALDYPNQATTSFGSTVPVGADGKIKIYVSQGPIDLYVDVFGYFDGSSSSAGAFTPGVATVASNVALSNGTTKAVAVTGVSGVPIVGSGISAVAMSVKATNTGSDGGYVRIWGTSQSQPGTGSLNFPHTASTVTNFVTTQVGNDGKINIVTSSASITVTLTVLGWYSNAATAIPSGQDSTQRYVSLQGQAAAGIGSWVSYQYRTGTSGTFNLVPPGDVSPQPSGSGNTWPETTSGGTFAAHLWDLQATLGTGDELVQVQACYGSSASDANPVCAAPDDLQYTSATFADNNATTDLGPGSLSLSTGDFQLSATDADAATSLGGLSVGRSLTTLAPAAANTTASGIFGPGWSADLVGADAGDADLTVTDQAPQGYLEFTDPSGGASIYQATTPVGSYPISFTGVGDAVGDGETVTKVDSTHITMADQDGTVTTWTKSGSVWPVTGVAQPGSSSTTTYSSYTASGSGTCVSSAFAGLPCRILAPVPAGVSCSSPDTTPGCRSLVLKYEALTVGGNSVTRLQEIDLSIPQTSGTAHSVAVAAYDYDTAGRLADAYDPRITPNLKTAYTYTSANRLATLTPPKLSAWSFNYDSTGRLSTISRPDPTGPTATTTVVYSVPLSGTGQPDLTPATTGTWDETSDLPVTGTAVFDPDHNPAGTTASTVSTSDWPYATINYLDVNGRQVNTADYGAGAWQIDTTQYDSNGNDVWDLSTGNRAQALSPTGSTDPYVAGLSSNVARAALLASSTVYNPLDSTEVTDTYGPTHPLTLHDGSVIDAQTHVSTIYDEGAPNGDVDPVTGAAYDLPTTVTTSAYNVQSQADTGYPDARVTHSGYAAISSGDPTGWSIRQATTSTVQMGGNPSSADLVTTNRYDANGRLVEHRLPGGASGGTAQSQVTTYYADGASGSCASDFYAGLVCTTAPAAQPTSGNPLPVTSYSYNQYGQVTSKVETYGTGSSTVTRTSATTYDAAERTATTSVSVTPASAGGTPVPTVTHTYDPASGLPTTTSTGSGPGLVTLTTGYDALGRVTSYTDATGNTSTTGYDLDGHVVSVNDGKGTTTYTYDSSSEHRGLVTSENIGVSGAPSTFSATYDAAGNLGSETYPNGLVATSSYDNDGNTIELNYTKNGSSWLDFTDTRNNNDDIVAQNASVAGAIRSTQNYTYDPDDRLTNVQDTYSGACTTRAYTFDADSNRTKLDSYAPASGGACSTNGTDTPASYSYDKADRLTSDTAGNYTYDALGRTTTVPSADATSIGANAATSGAANIGYDANDMVASQTQGSKTLTFTLDPSQDRINSISDGTITTTSHYSDGTDNPAWSSTGSSSWTRDLSGPDRSLDAVATQDGVVSLELPNLEGSVAAACADDPIATGVSSFYEDTEYGAPRSAASAPSNYGWLGAKRRSSADLGGFTLMGVRLYNPSTGRFLSIDPIPGGNDNRYVYPNNPLTTTDLSGRTKWSCGYISCTMYLGHSISEKIAEWGIGAIVSTLRVPGWAGALLTLYASYIDYEAWHAYDTHRDLEIKFYMPPIYSITAKPYCGAYYRHRGMCHK